MRAVALALFAQALAIGIQIYAIFREVGRSERIVTIVVLVVASVQIILTRPRRKEPDISQPGETDGADPPRAAFGTAEPGTVTIPALNRPQQRGMGPAAGRKGP